MREIDKNILKNDFKKFADDEINGNYEELLLELDEIKEDLSDFDYAIYKRNLIAKIEDELNLEV